MDLTWEFIKENWGMLKNDILSLFEELHGTSGFDPRLNKSFIALIPKVDSPSSPTDFRPISMVGCLYKIIAKVLTARLQSVIGDLIGENQFAFVKGRQIMDCSLIVNEVIHSLNYRGVGGFVLKVDFEKAYDSISWNFLDLVLQKMGFGSRWRCWIKACITTASMSVLVNGSPTKEFLMNRGLRQGCPLSPLLFNLTAEALSLVLKNATRLGMFTGASISNDRDRISHIQFADDTVIFCEPSEEQILSIRRILRGFQIAARLKVNFNKSRLFRVGIDAATTERCAEMISCMTDSFPSLYLGLPLGDKLNYVTVWDPIVKKFEKQLAGWKARKLSIGGGLTLINSVLSNLPMYYLSLFSMPVTVAHKLEAFIRRFLWGGTDHSRKTHWVCWNVICKYKADGGLGLVDMKLKNRAMLNKWLWRFASEKDNPWRRVIIQNMVVIRMLCCRTFPTSEIFPPCGKASQSLSFSVMISRHPWLMAWDLRLGT